MRINRGNRVYTAKSAMHTSVGHGGTSKPRLIAAPRMSDRYSTNHSAIITGDRRMDAIAVEIFEKYKTAFEELAK